MPTSPATSPATAWKVRSRRARSAKPSRRFRAADLFPLKVASADGRAAGAKSSPRVRARVMAGTYGQLSALLGSGVPLLRSLEVLREQTPHKNLAMVLEDVHSRVQEGATLADAMARHPRAFGELATSIVRAGGEGGFLEEALDRLAKFTEQQDELKSRVIGALAYPMILFVLGTIVVNVLIIFFVPKFETAVRQLARTRRTAGRHRLAAVAQRHDADVRHLHRCWRSSSLGLVIRSRLQTEEGRVWLDRWRLKVPVVSGIYLSLAVSRFCRVLGTLLTGGVPIVRSLEISADSTGNRVLSAAVREAAENISAGESLATPLAASGQFPRRRRGNDRRRRAIEQPGNGAAAHRRYAGTRHLAAARFVRPPAGAADAAGPGGRRAGGRDRPAVPVLKMSTTV